MSAADTASLPEDGSSLENALALMKTALVLLDEAEAPSHIGAHLDLAICQLSEIIDDRLPQAEVPRSPE
jgi:hypothetical protein